MPFLFAVFFTNPLLFGTKATFHGSIWQVKVVIIVVQYLSTAAVLLLHCGNQKSGQSVNHRLLPCLRL